MSVQHVRVAGAFVALAALSSIGVAGDAGPDAAPSANPEVKELLEYIRKLETRVNDLEREQEWPLENYRAQSGSVLADVVRSTNISGYIEFQYGYNFRHGPEEPGLRGDTLGFNQQRGSDRHESTFNMQNVQLLVDRPLTALNSTGFRVRADYGQVSEFNDRDVNFDAGDTFEVEEAYMAWRMCMPWDQMPYMDLAVGQFYSPLGLETPDNTYDNWGGPTQDSGNWLVTRNPIHVFGTPMTHTGIRASLPFSDCFLANLYLVNGWDNKLDTNDAKTVIANFVLGRFPGFMDSRIQLNASYGNETDSFGGDQGDKTRFAEFIWDAKLRPDTEVALDLVIGETDDFFNSGDTRNWRAASAYIRHHYNDKLWISARAGGYKDNGFFGGQTYLLDGSIAVGYEVGEGMTVAVEYRHDHSSRGDVYLNTNGNADDEQDTLTASFVYRF